MDDTIDLSAPIEMGKVERFKLKTHIKNYYEIIHDQLFGKVTPFSAVFKKYAYLKSPFEMIFTISNCIELNFNTFNGKLMKISVGKGYKGVFQDNISVGISVKELKEIEKSIIFDEDGECYKFPNIKGVSIICDPYDQFVETISLYIEEWDEEENFDKIEDFKKGNW